MTTKGSNLLIIIAVLGALFFGTSLKSHAENIKITSNDMQSRERWDGDVWGSPTGQCESYTGGDEGSVFELGDVVFPLEGVSLSYPLSVK